MILTGILCCFLHIYRQESFFALKIWKIREYFVHLHKILKV